MARRHVARPGESIDVIAEIFGWSPEALWNAPENLQLRQRRRNRNVLEPGDMVVIPDLRVREVPVATGAVHRFKRKGVPWKLRLRLTEASGPRRRQRYTIELDDGTTLSGRTDDDGALEEWLPLPAREGLLRIGGDEYVLHLSRLTPADTEHGAWSRLINLGFVDAEAERSSLSPVLMRFQRRYQLPETGELDEPTRRKLEELHGC